MLRSIMSIFQLLVIPPTVSLLARDTSLHRTHRIDIPPEGGHVRGVEKDKPPRCRSCSVPLLTNAEQKIGIHIRCVFEKSLVKAAVTIPRPRYGKRRL